LKGIPFGDLRAGRPLRILVSGAACIALPSSIADLRK
jgi:hypothetical protein